MIAVFQRLFNFDETYTIAHLMQPSDLKKIYPQPKPIFTSRLQCLGKKFRVVFPLFPFFIQRFKADPSARLLFSSSHAVAKGFRKSHPDQLHISYFHARNSNFIWDETALYFGLFRYPLFPLIWLLRRVDVKQAQNPDYIISNSEFVREWVLKTYQRDSTVIYPPVDLQRFELETEKEDYYVIVGRLAYIKRFDLVIQAFNQMNKKLVVIGDGDQANKLKDLAGDSIVFTGFKEAAEVNHYMRKAKGFIQAGVEGFGIALIEAQACGTPVIAYKKGGALETIIDGKTGIFFEEQTVDSIVDSIERFEQLQFNPTDLRQNALQFSTERFEEKLQEFVAQKMIR